MNMFSFKYHDNNKAKNEKYILLQVHKQFKMGLKKYEDGVYSTNKYILHIIMKM